MLSIGHATGAFHDLVVKSADPESSGLPLLWSLGQHKWEK